ncbi:unnamed protein product [Dovyalis caffra]|uniref:Uncharacterized protein n=1 Tax=Dovyalis caffra TaxID=77055 RepID=A0AAV1S9B9_9ROSI|nr:unnamed protein product [Dovyalis caffra]
MEHNPSLSKSKRERTNLSTRQAFTVNVHILIPSDQNGTVQHHYGFMRLVGFKPGKLGARAATPCGLSLGGITIAFWVPPWFALVRELLGPIS